MTSKRRNIVLLVGEDTGRHLGCYGEAYAHTPNLDRLAAEGCRFTNGFSHAPVCAPSRSGLVTGRYPWAIGTHHMRSTLLDPPRLFTHELRDAGYHIAWPTKTDFNFEPPVDFADTTEDVWKDELPGEPFFAFRNFEVTHESRVWDKGGWDGKGYADRVAALPEELHRDPAAAPVPSYLPDTPVVREDIARYFNLLALKDREVGEVLRKIDNSPQRDRTLVIYLTDHGRGLPREKRWCYDAGVHLPLIVRWPGVLKEGSVDERLVAWVDIAPTVLSLAGVAIPNDYDGQVFLGEGAAEPREYVYAGRDRMDEVYDRQRMVRSTRYHYLRNDFPALPWSVRQSYMEQDPTYQEMRRLKATGQLQGAAAVFMQPTKPAEELYAADDEHCLRNLADDPAHRAALVEHRNSLDAFMQAVPDLGLVDERELIERGLVTDRLTEEHAARGGVLENPDDRVGPERVPLTKNEADAYVASLKDETP